jgi:hypothetical protein
LDATLSFGFLLAGRLPLLDGCEEQRFDIDVAPPVALAPSCGYQEDCLCKQE